MYKKKFFIPDPAEDNSITLWWKISLFIGLIIIRRELK